MKLHANARICPNSRRLIVDRVAAGGSLTEAAEAAGVSDRTAAKWMARWRAEGDAGLLDRSSAPGRVPHRTSQLRVAAIEALRRLRNDRRGDRRAAQDAALDCRGRSATDRTRQAQSAGSARAAKPL